MAIKVSGTEVISNTRNFKNISSATGNYDDLRTQLVTVGTEINFNNPIMNKVMTANTTFTESNKAAGKTSLLILDTNTTGHTPTFSANIKWANDTTPTWSDSRYWHIALVAWDSTTVRAAASGYGSTGGSPSETISLSGTSGTPNLADHETVVPNDCSCGWRFKTDGTIQILKNGTESGQFQAGVEWCNVTPGSTYYVRATVSSGSIDAGISDAVNSWLALTSNRSWSASAAGSSPGGSFALLKIEIATDSGGSNIVATGYYQALCQVTP